MKRKSEPVQYAGNKRSKVYVNRKTALTASQKAEVSKIAKRVVLRQAETKSYYQSSTNATVFDTVGYARNLIYPIAQGATSETVIGEKLHIKNIRIKGQMLFNGTTEADKMTRFVIIKSEKDLTNSQASITLSDVFRATSNGSLAPTVSSPDLHKIDLFYDSGPIRVVKSYATHLPIYPIDINVNIDKTEYFDGDNSGNLKGGNYYFVFTAYDGSTANMANIAFDWTVNYKDL